MSYCEAPGCQRKVKGRRSPLAKYCSVSCQAKAAVYRVRRRRQARGLTVEGKPRRYPRRDPLKSKDLADLVNVALPSADAGGAATGPKCLGAELAAPPVVLRPALVRCRYCGADLRIVLTDKGFSFVSLSPLTPAEGAAGGLETVPPAAPLPPDPAPPEADQEAQ